MVRQDILLDATGDVDCVNGDFAIGDSDQQHIELLLSTSPGDWKQHPITGAGIVRSVGGSLNGFVKRNIKVQLEADGYSATKIEESQNGVHVNATTI